MPSPASNLSSTALTFTNASSEQCTTTFSSDGALEVSKPFFASQGVTASGLVVVNEGSSFVAISTFADIGASEVQLNGSTSGTLTLRPAATTTNHTLTLPSAQGAASSLLQNNGSGTLSWAAASTADTVGPSSATDNAVARFDTTTGKLLQNSGVTISDVAGVAGVKTIALSGATSGTLTVQPGGTTTDHTLTFPSAQGAASSYLKNDGAGALTWASAGDATGPSSATDNAVARFDLTTGKLLQNSGVTISDTADLAGAKTVALSGSTSGVLTLQPGATTTNHTLTLPSAQGAASTVLTNDGAGTLSWAASAGGGSGFPLMIQTFTASGTYTPTAGTTRALVYATGGGGAGGGVTTGYNNASSAGGNGAGTYIGLFVINAASTGTVTIGAGGAGGTGTGTAGASTTFLFPASGSPNATIYGGGGDGGTADTQANDDAFTVPNANDAGGSATATNAVLLGGYYIEGSRGLNGITVGPDYGVSGAGGRSFFAEGGMQVANNNVNSRQHGGAGTRGSGGSGAIQTNNSTTGTGGSGGNGIVVIHEY